MNKQLRKLIERNGKALRAEKAETGANSFQKIYELTFGGEGTEVMAEENDGAHILPYTYGQLYGDCERVAANIAAKVGQTHRWVGLEMENSPRWIAAFWGILRSGNKPYLINTRHPKPLADQLLETLGVTAVICDRAGNLKADYVEYAALQEDLPPCEAVFENELAIASSATSLEPTVCVYDGSAVAAQILNAEGILKKSKRMALHHKGSLKNLAFLPFYHIFGLFAVFFWFTFYRRTLVFLKDLAPDTILKTCRKHQVTHIFAVPMLWHAVEKQLLKQAEQQGRLEKLQKGIRLCRPLQKLFPYLGPALTQRMMRSVTDQLFGRSVKFCISGGSYLRRSALQLINGIGYPLHNGYGMSEIGIASVELSRDLQRREENAVGAPFDSVEYALDENGVLQVRGDSICIRRIKGRETLPQEAWFNTGDLMEQAADGRYYIRGRQGDLVIGESGENINPDQLEQLFDVKDAAAFSILGLPAEEGEILSMVVQVSPYLSAERINGLLEQLHRCNGELPTPAQVRAFYMTYDPIVAETAIKVGRKYLKRGIAEGTIRLLPFAKVESDGNFDRTSPLAQRVLEIIAPLAELSPEEIDCEAHLMLDLGLSSLQYFAMLAALAEEFGLTAAGEEEYSYTVRGFCEYIERHL